ncbi:MAG: hypothetical protein ACKVOR_08615 [Flavobacteriales bacterium]
MMKTRNTLVAFASLVLMATLLQACYYDNELYLYGAACDNTDISYNGRIKDIANNNCATTGCHAGPSPADNLTFEGYDNCRATTENTAVMCAIRRESGCNPMPKNKPQMSQCDIDAWQAWIDAGFPN